MSFHEVRFPAAISFGSSGGVERRTEVVRLVNGHEERNTPWSHSRRRYDAGLGMRALDDLHEVLAFFEARRGMLHGFRWKDWADHKSCAPSGTPGPFDQMIGTGDGTTVRFQLVKKYGFEPHHYLRPIVKPVQGSVQVAMNDSVVPVAIDHATGEVTFATPPAPGVAITAGFEFDVPVRFDTDTIEVNVAAFEAGEIPSIPVVELRV